LLSVGFLINRESLTQQKKFVRTSATTEELSLGESESSVCVAHTKGKLSSLLLQSSDRVVRKELIDVER